MMPIRTDPDPQTLVRKKRSAVAGDTHKVTLKTCTRLAHSGINELLHIKSFHIFVKFRFAAYLF
jgi:hypothetical protein